MITSLQLHIQQYTNVSVRQTAAKVTCSGGWQPCLDDLFIMELPHRSRQKAPPLTQTGLYEEERQLDSDRFHLSLSQPAPTGKQSVKAPLFRRPNLQVLKTQHPRQFVHVCKGDKDGKHVPFGILARLLLFRHWLACRRSSC